MRPINPTLSGFVAENESMLAGMARGCIAGYLDHDAWGVELNLAARKDGTVASLQVFLKSEFSTLLSAQVCLVIRGDEGVLSRKSVRIGSDKTMFAALATGLQRQRFKPEALLEQRVWALMSYARELSKMTQTLGFRN